MFWLGCGLCLCEHASLSECLSCELHRCRVHLFARHGEFFEPLGGVSRARFAFEARDRRCAAHCVLRRGDERFHRLSCGEGFEQRHADFVGQRAGPLIWLAVERDCRRQHAFFLCCGNQAEVAGGIADLIGREEFVGRDVELRDEGFDLLHCRGAVVAFLLRAGDDFTEFVGFFAGDGEACLLLLEFGKTLEFEVGQKFGHKGFGLGLRVGAKGFFAVWEGATFYRIGGGRIAFGVLVFRLRFAFVARAAWVAFGFAGIRELLLLRWHPRCVI
ncbi:hypothetical protein BCAR13_70002 [Paraburkholderia caribensis]|nr:hypothetical protein BCAR13_70002 [Paraburkholderia caribensis]